VIADQLTLRGLQATTGPEGAAPKDADAIVTYRDKWQWDMAMYMIELTIYVREPQTDVLLATGKSLHTSLTRKTPEEMAAEVLGNMFRGTKTAPAAGK
jgi:hypothetical protein